MDTKKKLLEHVQALVETGEDALHIGKHSTGDGQYSKYAFSFMTQCQAFIDLLGPQAEKWRKVFAARYPSMPDVENMIGALSGIHAVIEDGLLTRIENFVLAEAYSDWLVQAKHLLEKGYFLPAGVLGRAVLESHLRKWCEHAQCSPTKDKPMLADFKAALYAKQLVTKTEQAHIESMAAVGNDAAHAKTDLNQHEVERLLNDLTAFLANHPLP